MKLSEMTAEQTFDVVVTITPHIMNIIQREEVKELIKKADIKKEDVQEVLEAGYMATVSKVTPFVKLIFKDSKEDIFAILGAINGMTIEEVRKVNFIKLIKMVADLIMDKELVEVFTSLMG